MPEHHTILGGKVHVYKRKDDSRYWQCATYLAGKNRRVSTKEESLAKAKDFAEDWYLGLRGKIHDGLLVKEKTFRDAAVQFEREYEIITEGQRNRVYANDHKRRAPPPSGSLFWRHGTFGDQPRPGSGVPHSSP